MVLELLREVYQLAVRDWVPDGRIAQGRLRTMAVSFATGELLAGLKSLKRRRGYSQ